jgi:excisionase family DNA binding protein
MLISEMSNSLSNSGSTEDIWEMVRAYTKVRNSRRSGDGRTHMPFCFFITTFRCNTSKRNSRDKGNMETDESMQPLLDVNEAAGVLGVSHYTVRSWIRKGILNATKLGRLVRVEPNEVQKLIESGKREMRNGN